MVIYIRTEFAEVVEWQTRRTQNPLRDDLVRVQVPPSAPCLVDKNAVHCKNPEKQCVFQGFLFNENPAIVAGFKKG